MAVALAGRVAARRLPSAARRHFSAEPKLRVETSNGVKTLIFNDPKRLNAWTEPLLFALRGELASAGEAADVKAVVITGTDPYYCAGVDLSAMVSKPMWPTALRRTLIDQNTALFDMFLSFPKPLFYAVNGPAIGASVTSATLGEGIVASEKATFHTPFAALGLCPEGCSSVHFPRVMGDKPAQRMLGPEGWKPTAAEALEAGLVHKVVPHGELRAAAQAMAEDWVAQGKGKALASAGLLDKYKAANAAESVALADAFLGPGFFAAQAAMAARKGKHGKAFFFRLVRALRPLWGMGLPRAGSP